ncbi:MAG: hypothetical protein JWR07_2060 [Nevskia sp.]|nr:hypothetical protein [Nevskia sp.]
MIHSILLALHIGAAVIGLFSGAAALFSRKGGQLHRTAGNVFFSSMLVMSAGGAWLAQMKGQRINTVAGLLTFYMVATGWAAVKRKAGETGLVEYGLLLAAAAIGCGSMYTGLQANSGAIVLNDGPASGCFVFGGLALFAAALDVRVLVLGGVTGAQRIARHLWRMCFAMLMTTLSFFLGKQRLFPATVVDLHLNLAPILIVAGSMAFWIIRVHFTDAYKKVRGQSATAVPLAGSPARAGAAGDTRSPAA